MRDCAPISKARAYLCAVIGGAILSAPVFAKESQKIGSTSLCGDTYILALAPDHASHLSWQSRAPLSGANAAQRQLPQLSADPERLVQTKTDVLLLGPGEAHMAKYTDIPTLDLRWGEDFKTLFENAAHITEKLKTGDDIIQAWQGRLDAIDAQLATRNTQPSVLYLSRAGGSAGTGTFVDAVIKRAGGRNVITIAGWVTPDPEIILQLNPDIILTSYFHQGYESVQAQALRNAALRDFIAARPSVDIPGRLWPCAGPGLIEATEILSDALTTLERPL